jgi:carbonic anhydrase
VLIDTPIMRQTIAALLFGSLLAIALAAEWGYTGSHGPSYWGETEDNCNGQSQSPIDIIKEDAYVEDMGQITKTNYDAETKWKLSNNGHSAVVSVDGDFTIQGGGLPATYHLVQFHFHWGGDDNQGSEHTVNGRQYPMEVHFVHYNRALGGVGIAKETPEGLAVLGFFFEVKDEDNNAYPDNSAFTELTDGLSDVQYYNGKTFLSNQSLDSLLPENTDFFWRYSGSLTTPTCDETVVWTVFHNTIKISPTQLTKFRNLYMNLTAISDDAMVDNYRPVQGLNGRAVKVNTEHWTGDICCAAFSQHNLPPLSQILLFTITIYNIVYKLANHI